MKRTITLITCIALGALLIILFISCMPKEIGVTPPDVNLFHSNTTHQLLKIERAYEKILVSVGRAEAQGFITAERVRQIRGIADKVYMSIRQTKKSLNTFIATGGSKDLITSSMATLIELMSDLLSAEIELNTVAKLNKWRALGGFTPVAHCPNF